MRILFARGHCHDSVPDDHGRRFRSKRADAEHEECKEKQPSPPLLAADGIDVAKFSLFSFFSLTHYLSLYPTPLATLHRAFDGAYE